MTLGKPKYIELDFVKIEIYEDYIITNIKEGINFGKSHLDKLFDIFRIYFDGKPFVSIANRVNDYAIDPTLLQIPKFPGLLGIVVCCYSKSAYDTANFEKQFFDGPFEVYYTLEECRDWAENLLATGKN